MNLVKATPFRAAGRSTSFSFTFSFGAAVGQTLDKPQHCILPGHLRRSDTPNALRNARRRKQNGRPNYSWRVRRPNKPPVLTHHLVSHTLIMTLQD